MTIKERWNNFHKKYLVPLGLNNPAFDSPTATAEQKAYIDQDAKRSEQHMIFMRSLLDEENRRLESIENKSSQMIGQTGLIFSLLSLFVPLLADKVDHISLLLKIVLLFLLLVSFLFYILTISNALRNYNVKRFKYSNPGAANVQVFRDTSLDKFYSEVVRDCLAALSINTALNNKKASHLLQSFNAFRIANGTTCVLVVLFCGILLFNQKWEKPDANTPSIVNRTIINSKDTNKIFKPAAFHADTIKATKKTSIDH